MISSITGAYPLTGAVAMPLMFLSANAVRSVEAEMENRIRPKRSMRTWLLATATIGLYTGFALEYLLGSPF